MTDQEKSEIIDNVLRLLYDDRTGSLPSLLDGRPLVGHEKTFKYRIVEKDLIDFDLVRVLVKPGTNKTINGFGEYAIAPKGRELVMRNRSSFELYQPTKKEQLELDNLQLQNENLKYSQTIRDQQTRIRNLEEQIKFIELLKQYWWVLFICIGIGIYIGNLLDKLLP